MPERGVVYGVARDTTERRRTEGELREAQRLLEASRDELRALAEEQAALRRVATLVARETSPDAVFAAVGREVGEVLGVEATHLGRYDTDGMVVSVAQWGSYAGVPVGARFPLEGDSVSARVLRTGRAARMESYEDAPGVIADAIRQLGIRFSVGVPITVQGRPWGVMIASSKQQQPLAADTESRLLGFAELVATAIANTEARAELAASRARLVAAADEERRRVVRDLHDGAQQRLVHTVLTLKLAQAELQDQAGQAPELVNEALAHVQSATAELRELAHGILPGVLAHGGLSAATRALASRMTIPVEIDVAVPRLPEQVEAAAYFVMAEALTNVAKHAHAQHATVTALVDNGTLRVVVRDDGEGGARTEGSGLIGLRDRVATLSGTLTVASLLAGGTVVTATIPPLARG
jgi:signal transduction histidine kinase